MIKYLDIVITFQSEEVRKSTLWDSADAGTKSHVKVVTPNVSTTQFCQMLEGHGANGTWDPVITVYRVYKSHDCLSMHAAYGARCMKVLSQLLKYPKW